MAEQQQRYIVSKLPVKWPQGMFETVVRVDTFTGKTWVMVGSMDAGGQSHTLKWELVEDPNIQAKGPTLPAGA